MRIWELEQCWIIVIMLGKILYLYASPASSSLILLAAAVLLLTRPPSPLVRLPGQEIFRREQAVRPLYERGLSRTPRATTNSKCK